MAPINGSKTGFEVSLRHRYPVAANAILRK
jgi:hypothetical protein